MVRNVVQSLRKGVQLQDPTYNDVTSCPAIQALRTIAYSMRSPGQTFWGAKTRAGAAGTDCHEAWEAE